MEKALFLILILWSQTTQQHVPFPLFAIWNVGQGLWTSLITNESCLHIDVGGEKINWHQILLSCKSKQNEVFLTHNDWDHMSFLKPLSQKILKTCYHYKPLPPYTSSRKRKIIRHIKKCKTQQNKLIFSIYPFKTNFLSSSNAQSAVYIAYNQILIPGDSPQQQEKIWAPRIPRGIKILLLGHHGSASSTSKKLLQHLPQLNVAISSARKRKYGHPHFLVIQRLKANHIPLLKTED
ncbi:MAG: hydrolase, partial [Bdellovibrio sp.]